VIQAPADNRAPDDEIMIDLLGTNGWLWIAAALYLAAFLSSAVAMARAHVRSRSLMLGLVVSGLVAQTIGLYLRGLEAGGCPVRNEFEIVQFVVWSFTVLYVIVGPTFRVSMLGFFTSGLAVILSIASLLVPSWDTPGVEPVFGGEPWIEIHATLALFSYGAFGTLAITSLMFLLQNYSLKKKRLRGLFSLLPSLVDLEKMNFRILATGLAGLTFALVVGGVFYHRDPASVAASKLLAATAVWFAYLVAFVLRISRRLVGGTLAWTCLALFAAALLSLRLINTGGKPAPAPAATLRIEQKDSPTVLPADS